MNPRLRPLASLGAGLALLAGPAPTRGDDPTVSIADLAAYPAALAPRPPGDPAPAVRFRDLWEHPAAHQGRPVRVEGRLARVFRQPAVGRFPPLTEGWITSPLGEPTCLVFPTGAAGSGPNPGDPVRFEGTFLRRIAYPGGDARRLAPLIVGPAPPAVVDAGSAGGGIGLGPIFGGDHAADWGIGLAAAVGVGWALLRRHLLRPPVAAAPPVGPAPIFRDGDGDGDGPEFEITEGADHDDF